MADPGGRVTSVQIANDASRHSNQELVVLTANLWHDWPLRRRLPERMESFARLIEAEGVDVVLTQEVVRTSDHRFDHWLSDRLGMSCHYSATNGHHESIGFEEGLAIFARYPIASSRVHRFAPTVSRYINRQALGAEILTPFGNFWAFSVHLSLLQSHNASQVAALRDWVGSVAGDQAAVIGGDFNAPEHAPQIQNASRNWLDTFRHIHPEADGTTHEIRSPWGTVLRRNRLDYLFLKENYLNWNVVEARHAGNSHSDHTPMMARLSPAGISLSLNRSVGASLR
jgi:endonuclease/exonuclease/phosphatase family metal-dependent hydrolase